MDIKTAISKLDFDPEAFQTLGSLDGETLILDEEGRLHSLDDLACEYETEIEVTCIDKHGRMTTSIAHSFRIGSWTNEIYNITLNNGHKIRATAEQKLMGSSGDWIMAKDLTFGTAVSSATYDSTRRHPTRSISEVEHVHVMRFAEKIPTYSFDVITYDNILIAAEVNNSVSLVPAHIGIAL